MNIDEKTNLCGSIAIKQSNLGSVMHNTAYGSLGVNFFYMPFTVSDCENAVKGIRALNIRGSSVSMPYKQEVIKYLDKLDPIAKEIGAVNTIVNDNGVLTGFNSDWIGAMEALKEVSKLENKKVIMIGAGGAARAIAYGLKINKAETTIFNRTKEKARYLAKEFHLKYGGGINEIKKVNDYDILINATSVGFVPDEKDSVLSLDEIKENKIVMDVVINPMITPFLSYAQKKNCKIISGYRMLIYQALFQIEKYSGKKLSLRF